MHVNNYKGLELLKQIENARVFILKSNNDDDIHKAIKYQIWTSTQATNYLLNKTYKENLKAKIPILFIFMVNRSS